MNWDFFLGFAVSVMLHFFLRRYTQGLYVSKENLEKYLKEIDQSAHDISLDELIAISNERDRIRSKRDH